MYIFNIERIIKLLQVKSLMYCPIKNLYWKSIAKTEMILAS